MWFIVKDNQFWNAASLSFTVLLIWAAHWIYQLSLEALCSVAQQLGGLALLCQVSRHANSPWDPTRSNLLQTHGLAVSRAKSVATQLPGDEGEGQVCWIVIVVDKKIMNVFKRATCSAQRCRNAEAKLDFRYPTAVVLKVIPWMIGSWRWSRWLENVCLTNLTIPLILPSDSDLPHHLIACWRPRSFVTLWTPTGLRWQWQIATLHLLALMLVATLPRKKRFWWPVGRVPWVQLLVTWHIAPTAFVSCPMAPWVPMVSVKVGIQWKACHFSDQNGSGPSAKKRSCGVFRSF